MAKREEKPEREVPQVTKAEMDKLEKDIANFPQKKINGQLISSFNQWLCSVGVRRVDEHGTLVCLQPEADTKYGLINSRLEYRQDMQREADEQRNPELREERLKRQSKFFGAKKSIAAAKTVRVDTEDEQTRAEALEILG